MPIQEISVLRPTGFPTSRVAAGAGFFVRRLYGDNVIHRRCCGCSLKCATPSRTCAEQKAPAATR